MENNIENNVISVGVQDELKLVIMGKTSTGKHRLADLLSSIGFSCATKLTTNPNTKHLYGYKYIEKEALEAYPDEEIACRGFIDEYPYIITKEEIKNCSFIIGSLSDIKSISTVYPNLFFYIAYLSSDFKNRMECHIKKGLEQDDFVRIFKEEENYEYKLLDFLADNINTLSDINRFTEIYNIIGSTSYELDKINSSDISTVLSFYDITSKYEQANLILNIISSFSENDVVSIYRKDKVTYLKLDMNKDIFTLLDQFDLIKKDGSIPLMPFAFVMANDPELITAFNNYLTYLSVDKYVNMAMDNVVSSLIDDIEKDVDKNRITNNEKKKKTADSIALVKKSISSEKLLN